MNEVADEKSLGKISRAIRDHLEGLKQPIYKEIIDYPSPVAGCDAQYNHLLEQRGRITRELGRLDAIVRSDAIDEKRLKDIDEFLQSSAYIDEQTALKIRQA